MYKCFNCGARFDEPEHETLSKEDYYGVGDMFPRGSHHYFTLTTCPNCGSEDIEEYCEEDDDEIDA